MALYRSDCSLIIGGSEKFEDKQHFFFNELKKYHQKQSRSEIRVSVNRFSILDSVCKCILSVAYEEQ